MAEEPTNIPIAYTNIFTVYSFVFTTETTNSTLLGVNLLHRHNTIFSVSDCPGCQACDINPCLHGGQCNRLIGKAVCTCPPCYTGQHCEHGEWGVKCMFMQFQCVLHVT